MANYHLEVKTVSRGKGHSLTRRVNYISGERLHDGYLKKPYYKKRHDILYSQIFLPDGAPTRFLILQSICTAIEEAEKRYDARTAREFVGSLPNELSHQELFRIVEEFIRANFLTYGLCAIMAIHEGRNETDPSKNNPHVHIIVPTRTVGPDGFSLRKDREHDKRKYVSIWRRQWADVQNRAYERNRMDIRISHESLEMQGKYDREPTIHLSRSDFQKERRGERTRAGDRKREIEVRNSERARDRQARRERRLEIELTR